MKVGIKTGPKSWDEGQRLIKQYKIKYIELWYRYDRESTYDEVFQFLNANGVSVGLHFWGLVQDNILPSFCYDQPKQYRQGIEAVKQAIDVAAKHGGYYVNIHPGSRRLTKLDDNFSQIELLDLPITDEIRGMELLSQAIAELDSYAKAKNVLFLTETIPAKDAGNWGKKDGRLVTKEVYHASMKMLIELAKKGFNIANDFGHSAASQPSNNREKMWQNLYSSSQQLAQQTKLIHINTVKAPFNGTDSHDGILEEDWQTDVFPTEDQFINLLQLYPRRPDIWAIPEPKEGQMEKNYLALTDYLIKNKLYDE